MKNRLTSTLICSLILALTLPLFTGCGTDKPSAQSTPTQAQSAPVTPSASAPAAKTSTVTFTDSTGREVELPSQIDRIAPSGSLAQMILYAIAPEKLVGWSSKPSDKQLPYFSATSSDLPEFGQFYGKNVSLNLEALIAAHPQVIIDLGDLKKSHKEDMTNIQEQTKIPTIFIKATLDNYPEAFRTLGKILGKEQQGETLARFCEETIQMAHDNSAKIPADQRKTVYYGTGKTGLDANAKGSIHATVLDLVGAENALVVSEVSNKGGGNPIDREKLMEMNPQAIVLEAAAYKAASQDPSWSTLQAVQNHQFFEVPNGPYGFLSSPPSVNQLVGVYWLGQMLYPDVYNYNLVEKVQEFYKLFLHYDLSEQDAKQLLHLS